MHRVGGFPQAIALPALGIDMQFANHIVLAQGGIKLSGIISAIRIIMGNCQERRWCLAGHLNQG